jgi:hypothetical protein
MRFQVVIGAILFYFFIPRNIYFKIVQCLLSIYSSRKEVVLFISIYYTTSTIFKIATIPIVPLYDIERYKPRQCSGPFLVPL